MRRDRVWLLLTALGAVAGLAHMIMGLRTMGAAQFALGFAGTAVLVVMALLQSRD